MARERDVRNAIQAALIASGAFNDVWLSGLPEHCGQGADDLTAAAIEPVQGHLTTGWDAQILGGLDYTATCNVTLLARHPDPQLRDEMAERLLDTLANAVNGATLVAGYTVPGRSYVQSWRWAPPTPPERRIQAVVTYSFFVTWESWDVTA